MQPIQSNSESCGTATPENKALENKKNSLLDSSLLDTFFCDKDLSNISLSETEKRVQEVNSLIDLIRQDNPISIWDLCKKVSMSHSKLYYLLRDLEFAGVITSKVKLNKNNRSVRMISISKGGNKK